MRILLRHHSSFAVYYFGGSVIGLITRGIRTRKARDGTSGQDGGAARLGV